MMLKHHILIVECTIIYTWLIPAIALLLYCISHLSDLFSTKWTKSCNRSLDGWSSQERSLTLTEHAFCSRLEFLAVLVLTIQISWREERSDTSTHRMGRWVVFWPEADSSSSLWEAAAVSHTSQSAAKQTRSRKMSHSALKCGLSSRLCGTRQNVHSPNNSFTICSPYFIHSFIKSIQPL